ncbi:MAG: ion transporter [Gammaproteobacteria bacterium]|nr:ion transporter [Gammaproteobacteria bacterium]
MSEIQNREGVICTLVQSERFRYAAVTIILLNAVLIGIQVTHNSPRIELVQQIIEIIFVVEICLRWLGRKSTEEYFSNPWNYFDVIVVSLAIIPLSWVAGAELTVLRSLRALRILRLLHQIPELRLITMVLLRSIRSLGYSAVLFCLFAYVYAVLGVSMFKDPQYESSINSVLNPTNPDPYGTLGEAAFTLFRVLTAEDWTDVRYNLIARFPEMSATITIYHVSWMILAAFLLLNLVVGAVVNNYDRTMGEQELEDNKPKGKE